MCRFLVLANRGIDTSFGSLPMIRSMLRLLGDRVKYMKDLTDIIHIYIHIYIYICIIKKY